MQLPLLQDGDLMAQVQDLRSFRASSRRGSRSHAETRVIRRNTNPRHVTVDHHGRMTGKATLLVRVVDEILGTHMRWLCFPDGRSADRNRAQLVHNADKVGGWPDAAHARSAVFSSAGDHVADFLAGPAFDGGGQGAPQMPGHQQRGSFVLGIVGADHQLAAGVEFARRGERDGEGQRRAGAQRRRERAVVETELGATLAAAASVVVVVAEVALVPLRIFAMARSGVFRLARSVLVAFVSMLIMVVMVLAVAVTMVLAAFVAAARRVTAAAAPPQPQPEPPEIHPHGPSERNATRHTCRSQSPTLARVRTVCAVRPRSTLPKSVDPLIASTPCGAYPETSIVRGPPGSSLMTVMIADLGP